MATDLLPLEDITGSDDYKNAPLPQKLEALNSWGAYNAGEVRKLGIDSEEYADTQNGLQTMYSGAVNLALNDTIAEARRTIKDPKEYEAWKNGLAKSIQGIPDLTADAVQPVQAIGTQGNLVDLGSEDQSDIAMTLTRRRRLDGVLEVNINKSGVTGINKTIQIDVDPIDVRNRSVGDRSKLESRKQKLEQQIAEGPSQAESDFLGEEPARKENESQLRKSIKEIDSEILSFNDRIGTLESGNGKVFAESEELINQLKSRFKDQIQEDVFSKASVQEMRKGVVDFGTGVVAGSGRLVAAGAGAVGAEGLQESINKDADLVEEAGEDFKREFVGPGRSGGRLVGGMGERIFASALNESLPLLGQIALSGGTSLLVKGAGKSIGKFISSKAGESIIKNAGKAGVLVGGMSGGAREVAGSYSAADEFITNELGDYKTVELMEADAELKDDDALRKKAKSIRSARDTMVFNLFSTFVTTTGLEMIPLGKIMKRGDKTAFDLMDESMTKIVQKNVDNAVKGGKALTGSWDTIKRIGGDVLQGAFEEGGTEGVQTLVNNATAKALYDKNKDLFEGVAEAVAVGAILGSLANSAASIIGEKGARQLLKKAQEGVDAKGRIDEAADRFDAAQDAQAEAQASAQTLRDGVVERNGKFVTMNPATKRVETFNTPEGANNFSQVAESLSNQEAALTPEKLNSELEEAGTTIRSVESEKILSTAPTQPTEQVAPAKEVDSGVRERLDQKAVKFDFENKVEGSPTEWQVGTVADSVFDAMDRLQGSRAGELQAHGMRKSNNMAQAVKDIIDLLTNGVKGEGSLHTGQLVGKGQGGVPGDTTSGGADISAPFVLIAKPGHKIKGDASGVGAVLLNESNADMLPEIRQVIQGINPDIHVELFSNMDKAAKAVMDGQVAGAESNLDQSKSPPKNTGTDNKFLAREAPTTDSEGNEITVTRANLADITPPGVKTVHHETTLAGAKKIARTAEEGPRTHTPFEVRTDPVSRRRKPGKKYVLEIDAEQVQGETTYSDRMTVDKTTQGAVTAIIAPNQKGFEALQKSKSMNKTFDFSKAEQTPAGIRIPRRVQEPVKATTGGQSFPLKARDRPPEIHVQDSLKLRDKLQKQKTFIEDVLGDKKKLQDNALLADKSRIKLKGQLESALKDIDARIDSVNKIINSSRFKKQQKREAKEAKREQQRKEFDEAQEKAEADALRRMGSDINPVTGAVSKPSRPFDNKKTEEQDARDSVPEELIPPQDTQPESTTKAITRDQDGNVEGVTDTDSRTLLASTGKRADRRRAKIAQFKKGFIKLRRNVRNFFLGDPIQQVKFLLPADLTEKKAARENQQSAITATLEFVTRQYTRAFREQVSKDNLTGENKKQREDQVNKAVMDYMIERDRVEKAKKLRNIPKGMRAVVFDMRRTIDGLSQQLIESGVVDGEAVAIIQENLGAYLHRSYQLFNEPGYASTFEYGNLTDDQKTLINNAKQFFMREGSAVSEEEANFLIDFYLDPFNFNGGLVDTVSAAGAKSLKGKLSKQQTAILKSRKDVPEEIRKLWGEVEDPLYNYINSITKLAALVTSHGFLSDLKEVGEAEGILAPPGSKVPGLTAKISQEGAKALSPIDGWLMSPDLRDSLQVAYADGFENQYGAALGMIMRLNQIAKKAFTIYNPASQARNAISAFQAYISNGHFNINNVVRAASLVSLGFVDPKVRGGITQAAFEKAKKAGIINPATTMKQVKEQRLEYIEMIELGLLDQDVFSAEFAAVMAKVPKSASIDWIAGMISNPVTDKVAGSAKKVDEVLSKFYRSVDGLIKVADYQSNLNALIKAKGPKANIAELKVEAAARTKATIPTYDRVPEAVKKLSKTPFFGMFVAYPAESWRTSYNQLKLASKDLTTEGMRGEGIKRFAGMVIARSLYPVAAMTSRYAAGITSDDDDRFRESMPIYDQRGDIIYDQQDKPGILSYLNTQYIDAYSSQRIVYGSIHQLFTDPAEDIFSTNPRKGVADVVVSTLGPFLGTEAGFQALIEVHENSDHFGRQIYDENNIAEAVANGLYHVAKSVGPKAFVEGQKVFNDPEKNTIENAANRIFNPVRFKSMDMKRTLHFKMQDLNRDLSANSKTFVDSIVAGADIGESIRIVEEGRAKLYAKGAAVAQATMVTKVPEEETRTLVNDSDLNFVEADGVMSFEPLLFTLTEKEAKDAEKARPGFIKEFNRLGYKVFTGKKILDHREIQIEAQQERRQEEKAAAKKAAAQPTQ